MLSCLQLDNINDDMIDLYLKNKNIENNTITFNSEYYIEKNINSYKKSETKIYDQFCVDFPRTTVYYNTYEIQSIEKFNYYLDGLRKSNIIYKNINVVDIIIMLCNQSTYASPYYFIHKLYGTDKLVVCSDSNNRSINIYYDDYYKNMNIILEGQFKLINTETTKVEKIIYFTITIITNIIQVPYNWLKWYIHYECENNIFMPNIIFTWNENTEI